MFKKNLLILSLIFSWYLSFSQKQTNFWYFSEYAALNFNSGVPVAVNNSKLSTIEGSATMSDANGKLLFYTEGINVWDSTHTIMPNGTGLNGDISTSQSAIIIPNPGNSNLYYIFTIDDEGGDLKYSVVDMSLNSGKGDVTTKNTALRSNMTEKMTAAYHCNGHDIWVMAHDIGNNVFAAYLVTNAGVTTTAVTSNTGPVHLDVHGYMKFSPSGKKIACVRDTVIDGNFSSYQGKCFVDLFNFDNATGIVSNPLVLPLPIHQKAYGLEFSSDNSKLYSSYYSVTGINGGNSAIAQFDLSAGNIQASLVNIATLNGDILRAIQLGPDRKIYIAKSGTPFLCVVNNPNLAGAACNYTNNAVNVDPTGATIPSVCRLGLPNFLQSYLDPGFPVIPPCNTTTVTPPPVAQVDTCGDVFVPTGFSPNNDGQNDIECVLGNCISELQFSIYDRWGEKVFETTDQRQCWDGTYRSKLMNTGIYVYYLKATLQNGDKVEKKGNINLIR